MRSPGKLAMRLNLPGIQRQSLFVTCRRLFQATLALQRAAQINVCCCQRGLYFQGGAATGFGGNGVASARQYIAQVAVQIRQQGFNLNRLSIALGGLRVLASFAVAPCETALYLYVQRQQLSGLAQCGHRILALHQQGDAPGLPGLPVLWVTCRDFLGADLHFRVAPTVEQGEQRLQFRLGNQRDWRFHSEQHTHEKRVANMSFATRLGWSTAMPIRARDCLRLYLPSCLVVTARSVKATGAAPLVLTRTTVPV